MFDHGVAVTCIKCSISFVTYGNSLFVLMQSVNAAKAKYKKRAKDLAEADIAEMEKYGEDVYSSRDLRLYQKILRGKDIPANVGETAKPIDITAIASELDKRAVGNAVEEIADLKLSIQKATKEILRIKAENAVSEKELAVLKGEAEEEPDEALMRFTFVMEDDEAP